MSFFIQKVINQFVFRNCFKKTFISAEYHHNQIYLWNFIPGKWGLFTINKYFRD